MAAVRRDNCRGRTINTMNVTIKRLNPDLTRDYLDFFDHRAFSDNNPNGPCYCTSPSMDASTERQMVSEFGDDVKGTVRRYAVKLLAEGRIHGYLAFDDGKAVAWCNAGNMDDYVSWIPDRARQTACGKTMSVVCFAIAPEYRGMGVATALLERVVADAKADGYGSRWDRPTRPPRPGYDAPPARVVPWPWSNGQGWHN